MGGGRGPFEEPLIEGARVWTARRNRPDGRSFAMISAGMLAFEQAPKTHPPLASRILTNAMVFCGIRECATV